MSELVNIILYSVIIITFFVILITSISLMRSKKMNKELEELQREKNKVIGPEILSELSKVSALVKNEKIEEKYNNWNLRYDFIKNKDVALINDLLLEADFLLEQKKYKPLMKKVTDIEIKLYEAKTKTEYLVNEIREITLSEEKNRNLITKLKASYRELLQEFERSIETFGTVAKPVELQFEIMERLFGSFEVAMDNNDYDEVSHIVKALDEMISQMKVVIEEVPIVVMMVSDLIPRKEKSVIEMYNKLISLGFTLDYLNVEYNISEINKKISDIMVRVGVLNLEDVIFELKTFVDYFENLFNDFEREKLIRKVFEENIVQFKSKMLNTKGMVSNFFHQLEEMRGQYDLKEKDVEELNELHDDLQKIDFDLKSLVETIKTNSFPYSRLSKELDILMSKLGKVESSFHDKIRTIGNMKSDEERAREQLEEIKLLLNKSKLKVREYKLPLIPSTYYIQLKEAGASLKDIIKELNQKPIHIDTLNIRVDTARDLVFKLYSSTNEMIKTAIMAEMAMVYGNRYRSTKHLIEDGLSRSEALFMKGEYKKSLELSINTIDLVEPGFYRKLLNLYQQQ